MISFFYDTDSEINLEIAKEYGIENNAIRFPYSICGETFYADLGQTFDKKWFYSKINEGNVPTTSALNSEEFREYFEPEFEKGNEVFYVSFGTKFSAAFSMMDKTIEELKKKYPKLKFTRYDTKAISMGTGLLVISAAKALSEGKTVPEVIKLLDQLTPFINASLVVDDLSFLKRGGRLSAGKAFLGGILQLKPVIKLTKAGTLEPFQSISGKNKALKTVTQEAIENAKVNSELPFIIMNANCPEDALHIETVIRQSRPDLKIIQVDVGPVIGTHCGPGSIGLCFLGNERPESTKTED
jgi:DegV family protein with EDD domain